jgi:hypothetical protein
MQPMASGSLGMSWNVPHDKGAWLSYSFLLVTYLEVDWLSQMVALCLTFWGNFRLLSEWYLYSSHVLQCMRVPTTPQLQTALLLFPDLLTSRLPLWVGSAISVWFWFVFPWRAMVWASLHVFIDHSPIFFGESLIFEPLITLIALCVHLLLGCKSSLLVVVLDRWFANIFFHLDCLHFLGSVFWGT